MEHLLPNVDEPLATVLTIHLHGTPNYTTSTATVTGPTSARKILQGHNTLLLPPLARTAGLGTAMVHAEIRTANTDAHLVRNMQRRVLETSHHHHHYQRRQRQDQSSASHHSLHSLTSTHEV